MLVYQRVPKGILRPFCWKTFLLGIFCLFLGTNLQFQGGYIMVYTPLKINGWNIITGVWFRSFSSPNGWFVAVNLPGCKGKTFLRYLECNRSTSSIFSGIPWFDCGKQPLFSDNLPQSSTQDFWLQVYYIHIPANSPFAKSSPGNYIYPIQSMYGIFTITQGFCKLAGGSLYITPMWSLNQTMH